MHRNAPGRTGRLLRLVSLSALGSAIAASSAHAQDSEPLFIELDTISVTANLVPTPQDEVGSAVTTVTSEEIEQRQTKLVSDVLREIPGVAVNRTGPVGQLTQVRLRGSEGNQTLVIIDGIRVNDPSGGSEFDFAHLLAEEVERVEVLRGPQSALYGSDAIGGVINIVTKRGQGKPKARMKVEGGSFGTALASASVSGGGENYDFIASGAGYRTDGISVADRRNGNFEEDGYRNGTGFAKVNVSPSENFDMSFVGRYVDFYSEGDDFVGGPGAVDGDSNTDGDQVYGRAEGRLNLFEDRWEHIFGASYVRHQRDNLSNGEVSGNFEGETKRLDYQTNFSFDTPGFLDATHIATFAVQHEDNAAISNSSFSSFDRTIGSTGFVGQYQATLFDRLTLTASARHDDNDLFEDADTFRLTGAYSFFETGTKLRASYGTGVKNPTLFELFGFTANYSGNPDLKPEEARGLDVGVDQTFWDGRATLEATYFDQRIENLIQGTGQTSINLPGESVIRGAELGLTVRLMEGLTARAAYTLTDGEDANGDELVRRPRHIASLNLDYRFLDDRAGVNLGILYNGDQTDLAFDAAFNQSVVELDDYVLVNLGGSYKLTETAEIYGRVENLLDEEYQEVFTYGTLGRAAYAGLRLNF